MFDRLLNIAKPAGAYVTTAQLESRVATTAANIRAELDAQQKQSEVLAGEIAEMREDVKSRSDVQELRQDIEGVRARIEAIADGAASEIQLLRQDLADVKQDLHVLRQDFTASQQAKRTPTRKKVTQDARD